MMSPFSNASSPGSDGSKVWRARTRVTIGALPWAECVETGDEGVTAALETVGTDPEESWDSTPATAGVADEGTYPP